MPVDLAEALAVPDMGARLSTAVVVAVPSGRLLSVNLDGHLITCARLLAYTAPKVGDVALVAATSDGRYYALGALATGTAPTPPTPPAPPPHAGTTTFPAIAAGSYRGGGWRTDRSDVIQGDYGGHGLNQGAWFYGTAPAATLAGATVTAARVYVDRRPGGWNRGQEIRGYLHAAATRPPTPPARVAAATIGALPVGESAWLALPVAWGQHIAAGTARGIGIYSPSADPYIVLASLTQNGASGAIQLTWTRS